MSSHCVPGLSNNVSENGQDVFLLFLTRITVRTVNVSLVLVVPPLLVLVKFSIVVLFLLRSPRPPMGG